MAQIPSASPLKMESLSPEILELIIPHLFEVPPIKHPMPWDREPVLNVAQYATMSRKWQYSVERFTMADIKKYSTDLDMFRQVFSSQPTARTAFSVLKERGKEKQTMKHLIEAWRSCWMAYLPGEHRALI